MQFELERPFAPAGDQPQAIEKLIAGIRDNRRHQVLMGATGSGKTFTMANIIQEIQRPTLVISHNKTLAAQLYAEFKEFFPRNAVHYFVSYYDYYQPEAYIPQRDVYIEKDSSINEEIDRLRLAATSALSWREDVIIIASVSSIYGLGSPEDYRKMVVSLQRGDHVERDQILAKLVDILYERNDVAFERGKFRVRGDCVEVWPAYEEVAMRFEFWGDDIEQLSIIDPLTGRVISSHDKLFLFPAKHFVTPEERIHSAVKEIEQHLAERLEQFHREGKLLEAHRLNARTKYDMEMMMEMGYCPGIENYSRHLSGRAPGSAPETLYSFFPKEFLLFVDESHVSIPQIRAMYAGDHSRKSTLVEHGFRLPSALDNRPLKFDEWEAIIPQAVFVSATPSDYEIRQTNGEVVEQIIRPTGLLDPVIEVLPARGQVEHLLEQIRERAAVHERVLVTALTKRLAEDLSAYLVKKGIACRWLHSELDAFERVDLLRDLRQGHFDALVGVNLLREGLDLPEVSLVAILDADKEGFLRSETSLMQTIGRAARNVNAKVILYADRMTNSMQRAIQETERRRALQREFNELHGIVPKTIQKKIHRGIESIVPTARAENDSKGKDAPSDAVIAELLDQLQQEMLTASEELEFERAAQLRDQIQSLQKRASESGGSGPSTAATGLEKGRGRQSGRSSTKRKSAGGAGPAATKGPPGGRNSARKSDG